MTEPDPREGLDREHPGGLIEGGAADIPGVQDLGPADADEEREQDLEQGGTAGAVPPGDEE
ncbi:hypothetical protein [Microlunatus flavus]|uniref:Uncharacterized protein n=1 Tax=Microlunatus flavus TaxID=1036181 RepID=A0A1H9CY71_9ACTN|nr:hypothetical protein [Microlunatus flavus]SEQ06114.1 hypothetical protein SAMN05421756_102369 [Microlunatus flavus]